MIISSFGGVLLIVIRLIILALGVTIAYKSYLLSQRESRGNRSYLALSAGFAMFSLGAIIEGILFEFTTIDIIVLHIIEGSMSLLFFVLVLYAMKGYK